MRSMRTPQCTTQLQKAHANITITLVKASQATIQVEASLLQSNDTLICFPYLHKSALLWDSDFLGSKSFFHQSHSTCKATRLPSWSMDNTERYSIWGLNPSCLCFSKFALKPPHTSCFIQAMTLPVLKCSTESCGGNLLAPADQQLPPHSRGDTLINILDTETQPERALLIHSTGQTEGNCPFLITPAAHRTVCQGFFRSNMRSVLR